MRASMAFIVGVACTASAHAATVTWAVADGGNGNTYESVFVPEGIIWTTANAQAEAMGGHLVTLTSAAENQWVFDNLASDPSLWADDSGSRLRGPLIGGYQDTSAQDYSEPAGGWRWVTGEPFSFAAWAVGEPNNISSFGESSYLEFFTTDDGTNVPAPTWNDTVNGPTGSVSNIAFIVEYEVPAPSTFACVSFLLLRVRRFRR